MASTGLAGGCRRPAGGFGDTARPNLSPDADRARRRRAQGPRRASARPPALWGRGAPLDRMGSTAWGSTGSTGAARRIEAETLDRRDARKGAKAEAPTGPRP